MLCFSHKKLSEPRRWGSFITSNNLPWLCPYIHVLHKMKHMLLSLYIFSWTGIEFFNISTQKNNLCLPVLCTHHYFFVVVMRTIQLTKHGQLKTIKSLSLSYQILIELISHKAVKFVGQQRNGTICHKETLFATHKYVAQHVSKFPRHNISHKMHD